MNIGDILRRLRNKNRLSSRNVSEFLGISHSTYLGWERDKTSPSLKFYPNLAEAFKICPVELISLIINQDSNTITITENESIENTMRRVEFYQNYAKDLASDNEASRSKLAQLKRGIT